MSARYLVDTDVLSMGAPSKARPIVPLAEWMDRNSAKLFVSVITIAEIEDGIAKLARDGATRKVAQLREWLETLVHLYSSRILPFDLAAAGIAGLLSDQARGCGHTVGFADLAIAAIAKHRDLFILTRNVKDFAPLGVTALDPTARLPLE